MSWKQVIIMVGIWLGVTFVSASRLERPRVVTDHEVDYHDDLIHSIYTRPYLENALEDFQARSLEEKRSEDLEDERIRGEIRGCATVQCVFTVDNVVNSVTYNNNPLVIIGNASNWRKKNEISFESCSEDSPGTLTINGTDQNDSDHCKWGGLLLHCTASQNSSPWHNFVSDANNWKDENGNNPCQNDEVFPRTGAGIPFIDFLNQKGAKKIWTTEKTATLIGSPLVSKENNTLEWVEEIRGRMSQKLRGYNQKLIDFGSSMSEKLEEFTNALELNDGAVEVIEKICSKKGVTHIGKVIKCDRNCGTHAYTQLDGEYYFSTLTCSSTSCSLHCNQVSSCQAMLAHESTWMIECSETSTCQSLNATCTEGKTCFAKCSGRSSCQGAIWTGNWLVECSGPSSC